MKYTTGHIKERAKIFADSKLSAFGTLVSEDYKTGFKEGVEKYLESESWSSDNTYPEAAKKMKCSMKLTEGETYVYTGEDLKYNESVFLKNGTVVYLDTQEADSTSVLSGSMVWYVKKSDLAPLPKEEENKRESERVKLYAETIIEGVITLEMITDNSFRQKVAEEVERMEQQKAIDATKETIERVFPKHVRPPKGILPRKQHEEDRIIEIGKAIVRYGSAGENVPFEWIEELKELTSCK